MGFWNELGKVAKTGFQKLEEANAEMLKYYERYQCKSDSELKNCIDPALCPAELPQKRYCKSEAMGLENRP